MKRFIFCLLCLLQISWIAEAQYKVTESSERKTPSWVAGVMPGYLSCSGF